MSVEELKTVFQNADTDKSGSLDKKELRRHLKEHLGHKINEKKLNKLLDSIDTKDDNIIDLEEFLAYASSNPEYLASEHGDSPDHSPKHGRKHGRKHSPKHDRKNSPEHK